ncbi:MAG: hypothetical protein CMF25_01755 [Kangiellaceae bacterium]|nr:hypothetical protein [Kangiellaceae bacterium]
MNKVLDLDIHNRIKALCKEGDILLGRKKYSDARARYIDALRLLPLPHTNWQAATWIYVAVGDTHFYSGNYEKMIKCFLNAVKCPEGFGNPFIHLRLGQAYFELNKIDLAADELTRAYMGAGVDIFMEDNPKYLSFLEKKIEM